MFGLSARRLCLGAKRGPSARNLTGRAAVLDGLSIAAAWTAELAAEAESLRTALGRPAGLAIVLVGNRLDSQLYVQRKLEACTKLGLRASVDRLPAGVGQADLEARVRALSSTADVDGVLVQLPLPSHIDSAAVLSAVEPSKDVDGFHPMNLGMLLLRGAAGNIVPCAALSCLELLKRSGIDLQGKTAAVLGDSSTVGLPIALALRSSGISALTLVRRAALAPLLAERSAQAPQGADSGGAMAGQQEGLAHAGSPGQAAGARGGADGVGAGLAPVSRTPAADAGAQHSSRHALAGKHTASACLAAQMRQADVLVAAVGHAWLVSGDWVKPGATVLDVGINIRLAHDARADRYDFGTAGSGAARAYHVVGDVDYASVAAVAGAVTPVPGGVGPMTVAAVLHNTLQAARLRRAAC